MLQTYGIYFEESDTDLHFYETDSSLKQQGKTFRKGILAWNRTD